MPSSGPRSFLERARPESCYIPSATKGHEVVAADLPLFIVEMHTPGAIVEARRPFRAETAAEALLAAKG